MWRDGQCFVLPSFNPARAQWTEKSSAFILHFAAPECACPATYWTAVLQTETCRCTWPHVTPSRKTPPHQTQAAGKSVCLSVRHSSATLGLRQPPQCPRCLDMCRRVKMWTMRTW
ncbi:hypothetical protein NDU88_001653 [Pleurodeles waltl]|uniref:Uncharacterized protein n=1 Tax=Pleurodeles waltl TaxID=8319 RepID=A0AAV7LA63_PLEWA|nr:hypothetical protein NDU88_001653 [Pleurodeles waltl]